MDMAVANLLKHKVHFSLIGHDGHQYEPYSCSKGYHYVSNEIENGESIDFKSTHDSAGEEMSPLFSYILSTMEYEMEEVETTDQWASIKIHLINEEDHIDYIAFEMRCEDFFSLENCISTVNLHPRNLLDQKFSIYVEAYVYYIPLIHREEKRNIFITPKVEAFKEDCCVICLESKPNILYLDCMHIAVCDSCDNLKIDPSLMENCDVCRAEISRRIKI